jgi:phosphoribosyl-AMP cyclohydrolase
MKYEYFTSLEGGNNGQPLALIDVLEQLAFNDQGLIPVITQDVESKDVLMLAWMSSTSIKQTLATGKMTYWSRSRKELWVKGATSGHHQSLSSMSFDCDGDAILCLVNQTGSACHTGRKNCFYLNVDGTQQQVTISN